MNEPDRFAALAAAARSEPAPTIQVSGRVLRTVRSQAIVPVRPQGWLLLGACVGLAAAVIMAVLMMPSWPAAEPSWVDWANPWQVVMK